MIPSNLVEINLHDFSVHNFAFNSTLSDLISTRTDDFVDNLKLTAILYFFVASLVEIIQINDRSAQFLSFNVWKRRTLVAIERDFVILHSGAK